MMVKTYLFFQRSLSPVSRVISRVTGPVKYFFNMRKLRQIPSHVGIMFDMDGTKICYEAHMNIPNSSANGWHGPFDWDGVVKWKCDRLERNLWLIDLDISEEQGLKILDDCENQVGHWDYAKGQLGFLYLWRRFRIPMPSSPAKIVCSEGVGRVCYDVLDIPKIAEVKDFERLTPWNIFKGLETEGFKVEVVECPFL